MTVQSTTFRSGPYAGTGGVGPFMVGFRFLDATHLVAIVTSASGVESTLTSDAGDFSVSGVGNDSGGSITLTLPLPVGSSITIQRDVPLTQLTHYEQSDPFPASAHEDALDKLTMAAQQLAQKVVGALRVPETAADLPTFPAAAARANKVAAFDAYGRPIAVIPVDGSVGSLAIDLTNSDNSAKGAGQVGFTYSLGYGAGTIGGWLKSLADGPGSDFIGFLQGGAGAVARSLQAKVREQVSIRDFGAVGNGATDDTAAILAALAASKHVYVPPGMTCLISSTIPVPVATWLEFRGGLGNASGQYPASYFIKKSTMTTAGITVAERAMVSGGGLLGQGGNTGNGIQIIGNNGKISHFLVHGIGGDGVRVGTDDGGNFNSFELDHVTSQYNTGRGFYIHDGKLGVGADANAGTIKQPFAQYNGGDGITLGHCFWVTVINGLSEVNTGWGLRLLGSDDGTGVPICRYATIVGGDYNEGNTAGQVFDQSYFSTWIQPDGSSIPNTASSGLAGSARRNVIGSIASRLEGLVVKANNAATPLVVDDGTAGGMSYPQQIKKTTTGTNGDGAGLAVVLDGLAAGRFRAEQVSSGQYNCVLSGYKSGASLDILKGNVNANGVHPAQNNAWSCGISGLAWSGGYTQVAFTVVSDLATKQDIQELSDAEAAVARDLKGLMRTFRLKDSVAEKGDDARIHVGAIAQDVRDAFIARGLDPHRYAMFCSDSWWELDGAHVDEPVDGAVRVTRLGLRYEQLLAFVIAAT